jgi:hypothetical protein
MIEPDLAEILANLDLTDKQSIVDLMFLVQGGTCSCRRAASEIQRALKEYDWI